MTFAKGRGVRVEVATAYAAAKTVSEVTAATTGVATSTAHGLANKTIGYFSGVVGMPRLEGQACRVTNSTTNSFDLEGVDTTAYGDYTAGTFTPVQTWATLNPATDYNKTGGEASQQDVTVLLDDIAQNEAGLLAAEAVAFTMRAETTSGAAKVFLDKAALANDFVIIRITLKDGAVRYFRGQPGRCTESLAVGGVGQQTFNVTIKGVWMEGAA